MSTEPRLPADYAKNAEMYWRGDPIAVLNALHGEVNRLNARIEELEVLIDAQVGSFRLQAARIEELETTLRQRDGSQGDAR